MMGEIWPTSELRNSHAFVTVAEAGGCKRAAQHFALEESRLNDRIDNASIDSQGGARGRRRQR